MKWVTRDHLHLDRVACPWLIRRFIDPNPEFIFIKWGEEDNRPQDAIPFAIPGVELGPHDAAGTTFEKFIKKYELSDPALSIMGPIVGSGVHHALHKGKEDENDVPSLEGIGLDAISEGMMLTTDGDMDNLDKSMGIYDAIYAYCKLQVLKSEDSSLTGKSLMQLSDLLKPVIKAALSGK